MVASEVIDQMRAQAERQNQLKAMVRPVRAPFWLGAERGGVERGAAALDWGLRQRWADRHYPELLARLDSTVTIPVDTPIDAGLRLHARTLQFEQELAAACDVLAATVSQAIGDDQLALVLGGDHSLAIGSVAGAAATAQRLGLLWIDAHTDINTPRTSPSGHIHGMPIAILLGLCDAQLKYLSRFGGKVRAEDICFLGVRDIDPGERALIIEHGIWTRTMANWTDGGIVEEVDAALAHLTANGVDAIHVSFDVDVLDKTIMPATGTPVSGGLFEREASQVLRRLHQWDGPIRSVDFVELNPSRDPSGDCAELAVGLLATLLGESML